jgi:uncharacterized membrane-anchored protein YhcB (DUF1043 family)
MEWVALAEAIIVVALSVGFLSLALENAQLRAGKLFDEAQIECLKNKLEQLVKAADTRKKP